MIEPHRAPLPVIAPGLSRLRMQEQSNVGFDRLARSSRDLQNILHELQEIGCGFVSLGETWCDTRPANGRPNSQS
jgi:hypothetical protein